MSLPPVESGGSIRDAATLRALENLAGSRERLRGWFDSLPTATGFMQGGGILRSALSFTAPRLPWLRWGLSALLLVLRSRWRRRRR